MLLQTIISYESIAGQYQFQLRILILMSFILQNFLPRRGNFAVYLICENYIRENNWGGRNCLFPVEGETESEWRRESVIRSMPTI